MILDELKKVDLNGITVLSVSWESEGMRIVFKLPFAKVEFKVDDGYQLQILSVDDREVKNRDAPYLAKFELIALDVMKKVKLVEMKKRAEYELSKQQDDTVVLVQSRLETLMLRETQIKTQEQELDLKEKEIKNREKLLYDKEAELILQRQADMLNLKAKRLKNREHVENVVKKRVKGLFPIFKKQKDKACYEGYDEEN